MSKRIDSQNELSARRFPVWPGAPDDACQLCGIHRQHAGYIVASCGSKFCVRGCFVLPPPRHQATHAAWAWLTQHPEKEEDIAPKLMQLNALLHELDATADVARSVADSASGVGGSGETR